MQKVMLSELGARSQKTKNQKMPLFKKVILSLSVIFVIALGSTGTYLFFMTDFFEERLNELSEATGLVVEDILVEGRERTPKDELLSAIGLQKGDSIFLSSPLEIQDRINHIPWVLSSSVQRKLPSKLYINIVERVPSAIWQHEGVFHLVDASGAVIAEEGFKNFPGLPLIVGEHAPQNIPALMDIMEAEPDLRSRILSAVFVGGRRWDLSLDSRIDIRLPEENPKEAWMRLASLDKEHHLLDRAISSIDMRLSDRLVVRVSDETPIAKKSKKPHKKGKNKV